MPVLSPVANGPCHRHSTKGSRQPGDLSKPLRARFAHKNNMPSVGIIKLAAAVLLK